MLQIDITAKSKSKNLKKKKKKKKKNMQKELKSTKEITGKCVCKTLCPQSHACPYHLSQLSLIGIIQSNIHTILRIGNQGIYIMYPNCMPRIMILAQAVLQIFCSQCFFTIQIDKVGKMR